MTDLKNLEEGSKDLAGDSVESLSPTQARAPYLNAGEFGFTNDENVMKGVRQYVSDAVADGWTIEPTYKTESADRAAHLRRDGFVMSVIARDDRDQKGRRYMFSASVSIWGPDGMAIRPPRFYNFDEIKARVRACDHCGAKDVETVRYSFAGRCCAKCLPEMRAKYEKPGWCD